MSRARQLLDHDTYCGDGARDVGRVIVAAASSAPGKPHSAPQARSAYAVLSALSGRSGIPAGLETAVARVMAEYVVDVARAQSAGIDRDATGPVEPGTGAAALDDAGRAEYGPFLDPRETHAAFGYEDRPAGAEYVTSDVLTSRLSRNPEAFAILYDAERAYFAYYLERLTDRGGDPAARLTAERKADAEKSASDWRRYDLTQPDTDLGGIAERIGTLAGLRTAYATDGDIEDLATFDRLVREHTRGAYRPSARRVTARPPMNTIAARRTTGDVRGDLFDGREQLNAALEGWVRERGVSAERAAQLRDLVDERYVSGLWSASLRWGQR
ncbi:hypothetical protein [Streptomyces sp. NPDC016845]|uniref:hypothetical protein n=1 Tax=Streptomyces sp. NPDC016845 TaxID=3364972 RepID=UPI0037A98083